jgi:hypothetical protein
MRGIALLSLGQGRAEEAAALLRDGVLPLFEAALEEGHPDLMFTSGLVGVAQLAAGASSHQSQPRGLDGPDGEQGEQEEQHDLGVAETLAKSALDFLGGYEHGPYAADHPWVNLLGGFSGLGFQKLQGRGTASEVFGVAVSASHADDLEEWAASLLLPPSLSLD